MSQDSRIDDLLTRWEALREAGQTVAAEQLTDAFPELAVDPALHDELRRRVANLQVADRLLGVSRSVTPPPRVPGYEVLDEAGRGGMGVVYRARHQSLDRQVAIKITAPGAPVERFLREAKLLARIHSPHVVVVHDFAILPDGSPMLVMEWIEGTTLSRVMAAEKGPLAEDRLLPWMRQTAEGMLAGEEEGIVHRDLKPSNILIDHRGRALVADFGLARGVTSLGELTLSGSGVMGTPYYMAPEQAESPRSADTRADIYSFGATFYHALTGHPPFTGESAFAILYRHKTEPLVSPKARAPRLSDRVGELLERCLAKSPNDRFPSFRDVLKHLQPTPSSTSPWDASDDAELASYLERYQARRDYYLQPTPNLEVELDVYRFPRGRVLRIIRGDIINQKAEVLVSSDQSHLTMDLGVSGDIRRAGGVVVLQEALRYAPVRPGRVVVTSAGSLPARFVFHAVTQGVTAARAEGHGDNAGLQWVHASRDLILELLASCFYHADTLFVRTIALPLLGTGAAGFSKEVCLDTMFQFLAQQMLRGLTTVQEARIVIFP